MTMSNIQARDIEGNLHEVSVDTLSWRPSVYGIVIHDGKILLSPQHGLGYDLPGGGIEIYESIDQAVVREVKEETGLDVTVGGLAGVYDNIFVWKPGNAAEQKTMHSLLLYYGCILQGGTISIDGFTKEEKLFAEKAIWLPLEQLSTISVASSHDYRQIVCNFLEKSKITN